MAENVETSLLEKLVERAVQQRLQSLQDQQWAHHWLLTELVRQLPRQAVLETARRLDQLAMAEGRKQTEPSMAVWSGWHQYLCQLSGAVDGDAPPPLTPGQPVPPRLKPLD